ncbi:MAG: glycosyltransferase [Floccifex sp.]
MKVAKRLPDVSFYIAMPKSAYEKYVPSKPSNVSLFTELSGKDFFELQSNCSLTFLPLTSQAPSGLIVLFSATLMERPVIMTNTVCTQEYVDNGDSGILKNTEEEFAESIIDLLSNSNKRKEMAIKQKDKIKEIGSPESYIRELSRIINGII